MTTEAKKPYEDLEKFEPWMIETAQTAFSEGESITSVCADLNISRETYYRWRDDKSHPFSAAAKQGERQSQKYWEGIGKDGIIGGLDKFAGSSWMFVMKNRFRDSYNEQQKDEKNTAVEMLLNLLVEKNK
jgi:hypothetical protein